MVRDSLNSFLLTRDKRIFVFKSFKRVVELDGYSNIKLFDSFNKCYVIVEQTGAKVMIRLLDSFNDDRISCSCEFDLSFPSDSVSINSNRNDENICVEMIEGPLSEATALFFTELLACNLQKESVCDILLTSIDNKLIWVKYKDSFTDGAIDGYTIESITTANGAILGIKFYNERLLVLDETSLLSVFYLCPMTGIIKKKEMQLNGKVKCFRFYRSFFIYSNMKSVFFVSFSKPGEPDVHSVDLKGIVCFTVVPELNAIVAICHHCMFYHLPVQFNHQRAGNGLDFQDFTHADVESIPSVTRFFEVEEQKLMKLAETVRETQSLKFLLQHLSENKDFVAGSAIITFLNNMPKCSTKIIFCKVTDQKLGNGFIEVKLNLKKVLLKMRLSITLSRHLASGVADRIVKIDDACEENHIVMPAETTDDASNKMTLDLIFSYKSSCNGEEKLITLPINIIKVIPFDGPRIKLKGGLDDCLQAIKRIKL